MSPASKLLVVVVSLVSFQVASPKRAWALGEGEVGWCTVKLGGGSVCGYGSAAAACHRQWQEFNANPQSRDLGSKDTTRWDVKDCDWTRFAYGCTGGISGCGTVIPSIVNFSCSHGYVATPSGCIQDPKAQRPCSSNYGASLNFRTTGPIDILSGSKIIDVSDFETVDDRLRLARTYRSFQFGPSRAVMGNVKGVDNVWRFNFSYELHINGNFGSSDNSITVHAPDGTSYSFLRQSDGSLAPTDVGGIAGPQTDYRVEFVGTWPSPLSTIFNSPTQWRVTDPNDTVWLLQTVNDPLKSPAKYPRARPISMTARDGYQWTFTYGSLGELQSITDSFGRSITFSWIIRNPNTLPNTAGMPQTPAAISQAVFPDGTKAKYTYETIDTSISLLPQPDRLSKVEYLDAANVVKDFVNYHYEDASHPRFVTGITDGRNIRTWNFEYNGVGRATKSEKVGAVDRHTVSYSAAGSPITRTVANPLGKQAIYQFEVNVPSGNADRITGVQGQASTNCPASASSYTYGTDRFIATTTDEEGRVTAYVRDSRGRPTSITRGYGTPDATTTTKSWHATFNVPLQIVEPGVTTDLVWNGSGQLTSITKTDTTSHTVPYSTNGQTRTWTYGHTGTLLTSIDGPLAGSGDTVTYTYNSSGYLASITNELGHVTTVDTVNGRGQPTLVTDPNGIKTAFTYDVRGRVLTVTRDSTGSAAVTTMEYNGAGDIAKITQPDGTWQSFTYDDARRLTTVTNSIGETINYVRNLKGNATSITRKKADTTITFSRTQAFDELGRLLTSIGAASQAWSDTYDKTDNLVSVTDPRSNVYTYAFDALNRLIRETDEESAQVNVTRNGVDDIVGYKDPRNLETTYVRSGFGEVIQEASPDKGTTVYQRDARGLITQRTDARGVVTNYGHDNAGRITSRTYPASTGENVAFTYDDVTGANKGKGRLTGMTDASGTTAWIYDARGNALSETWVIDGKTYVVSYSYNAADKVTQMVYPSGRIVDFARDGLGSFGRISGVSTKKDSGSASESLASNVAYQPFGALQSLIYGNGLSLWKTFTADDELDMLLVEDPSTSAAIIKRFHTRTDNGLNLTNVWDDLDPSKNQSFWYTANRRLQNANGPWGELTYSYDGVGNRTYETLVSGGTTTENVTGYESTSNRMTEVTTNGMVSRTFGHTAAGHLDSDTKGGVTWTYAYNHAGRLATATAGSLLKGTYTYDGLERLAIRAVTNTTPSGTIHYAHDLAGHIIAEANASTGTTTREYVWLELDDEGLSESDAGRITESPFHLTKLGAAEKDSDPTSRAQLPSLKWPTRTIASKAMPLAVVADVDTASPTMYYVHSDHLDRPIKMTDGSKAAVWDAVFRPYGDAVSISGVASIELRLPGQWFQLETGLHYNWHRHYDSTIGRYMQADPLGFVGGPSVYAYARSSPLVRKDMNGLGILPIGPMAPKMQPPLVEQCISSEDRESCVNSYVRCTDFIGNGIFETDYSCGKCLRWCTAQGYWPFHLCPRG